MKLTKKLLRSINVFNAHTYASGNPYIHYRPADYGRATIFAAWMITWDAHEFKDTHWRNYGSLAFEVYERSEKNSSLLEAQDKFKKLFGVSELSKTPFGSFMDKKFVEERNAELIKKLKDIDKDGI